MTDVEISALLSSLTDEELDTVDQSLKRIRDAQQTVDLLTGELDGQLQLLREAHK